MFWGYFKISALAVAQIFFLAAIGFVLLKKKVLSSEGLNAVSKLVINVTLPVLIFCQLTRDFNFREFSYWWIFPLLSIVVTLAGFIIGGIFIFLIKGAQKRLQFLSLVAFQNSGYLPLGFISVLFPYEKSSIMLIYLFLFLAGFNMVMFSLGVHMLTFHKNKKFELMSLFSPPVIATIFSLLFIYLGLNRVLAPMFTKTLFSIGECTLPLAMFVVGGNLAQMKIANIDRKPVFLMSLAKLIILPLIGLFVILRLNLPELIGLFIVIQLAMPSATLLSVINSHYNKEDLLISQGIFFSHILSLITIPLFLSLFFILNQKF